MIFMAENTKKGKSEKGKGKKPIFPRKDAKKGFKREEKKVLKKKDIKVESKTDSDETSSSDENIVPVPSVSKAIDNWVPKTELGRMVKEGKIKTIDEILDKGQAILEEEIVDTLLPNMNADLLMIGQAKGKFGGGQKRVFRQTQKKTEEGNKPHFCTCSVCGDGNGHVGVGIGKAKETVPAREKAIRKSKMNIFKIRRGCGSWVCNCAEPHSIPYKVAGKCSSVIVELMPAPKGKGLVVEKEIAKILEKAGIKDVWCRVEGQTRNKLTFVNATVDALRKLTQMKVTPDQRKALGIADGSIKIEEQEHAGNEHVQESVQETKDESTTTTAN
jgi:small subunit ribosomal protein S5